MPFKLLCFLISLLFSLTSAKEKTSGGPLIYISENDTTTMSKEDSLKDMAIKDSILQEAVETALYHWKIGTVIIPIHDSQLKSCRVDSATGFRREICYAIYNTFEKNFYWNTYTDEIQKLIEKNGHPQNTYKPWLDQINYPVKYAYLNKNKWKKLKPFNTYREELTFTNTNGESQEMKIRFKIDTNSSKYWISDTICLETNLKTFYDNGEQSIMTLNYQFEIDETHYYLSGPTDSRLGFIITEKEGIVTTIECFDQFIGRGLHTIDLDTFRKIIAEVGIPDTLKKKIRLHLSHEKL